MLYFSRWVIYTVLITCFFGILFSVPNFFPRDVTEQWPAYLPSRHLTLGLDLRGGSSILLEVDVPTIIAERMQALQDSIRTLLRTQRIDFQTTEIEQNTVTVILQESAERQEVLTLITELTQPQDFNPLLMTQTQPDVTVETTGEDGLVVRLSESGVHRRATQAIEESIEIIRRRIDETGVNEPLIARHGSSRILVQLPGLDDPERIKDLLGQTAKMTFHLLHPDSFSHTRDMRTPPGTKLLESTEVDTFTNEPTLYLVRNRIEVDGANLIDAQPATDPQTGQWVVNFSFDSIGARRFAQVTRNNVNRPFAIVLDDKVISAPVIREPILGGRGQISGQFTLQSANDLSVLLRAGALPAPLTIVEERTVGPDLGADAIRAGFIACVIGFCLVIVYMGLSYGLFGLLANVALVVNLFLVIGVLSVVQATLTLPGIAGLLLTLGMAVDANILINERIREETRRGRSPYPAMEAGFQRAISTILDSNITTLVTMILLYYFGSGPVRGFAVTISCGILTTMFSTFFLSRLMMVSWLRLTRATTLPV